MILRGLKFLRSPVMTPASISGMTPSETSSLCTPRSLRSISMGKNGVGNAADSGLEHGTVFNQAGDVAGDGDMKAR